MSQVKTFAFHCSALLNILSYLAPLLLIRVKMDEHTSSEPAGELLHICQRSVAETGSQICLLFPLKFVVFDLRRIGFLFRCVT